MTTSRGPRSRNAWIGMPVSNGTVSGFGIDQLVMGAEAPPPIIKPAILVVEIIRTTIQWDAYSVRGKPKPYFVMEDGELRPVELAGAVCALHPAVYLGEEGAGPLAGHRAAHGDE